MTPQQAKHLSVLIRHMETTTVAKLEMGYISNRCGTPACAIGHAAHLGIGGLSYPKGGMSALRRDGRPCNLDAADDIFGVHYARLFAGYLNGKRNPAPREWAAEARKVLTENGYSMDDGFPAFMEKTLTPLDFKEAAIKEQT